MDKLKPCPFCGEIPTVKKVPDTDIRPWYVRCCNNDCEMWVATCNRDTKEEAIKTWNKRSD